MYLVLGLVAYMIGTSCPFSSLMYLTTSYEYKLCFLSKKNNPSIIDNKVEKELQEEAAFEGVRCLLGEEDKECEVVNGEEEGQVLNQSNHNGSSLYHSFDEIGHLLNALNIKLISVEKEEGCNKKGDRLAISIKE